MLWQEFLSVSSWNTLSALFGALAVALVAVILVQNTGQKSQVCEPQIRPFPLPFDVVHQIAQHLSVKDLVRLSAVSKYFLYTLDDRSIWLQVMKDILGTTPIPYLHMSLPTMSTGDIIRACVTAYRIHQYLSTSGEVIPVTPLQDAQLDYSDVVALLPGGKYFVMSNLTSLVVSSVEDLQSRMLLYSTAGTELRPLLLATHCISSSVYRMVVHISTEMSGNKADFGRILLVDCNPPSGTTNVIASKELDYVEDALASYIDDRYWAYLTCRKSGSHVVCIVDLSNGNCAYVHLVGLLSGPSHHTLAIHGNFFIYGSSTDVLVYSIPPITGQCTEPLDMTPVWERQSGSRFSDRFHYPLLCSQPLLGSPLAFAAWGGSRLILIQQDAESCIAVKEHPNVLEDLVYPSIHGDTRATTGVTLSAYTPTRECSLYRVSFHGSELFPGMMRLDQDTSLPEFTFRRNVDASWALSCKDWAVYRNRVFFDEASGRFLVLFKAGHERKPNPVLRVMVLSLVP